MNIRPLTLRMPFSQPESTTDIDELQASPQFELEALELEKDLNEAELQLNKGPTMASGESDADAEVVSLNY